MAAPTFVAKKVGDQYVVVPKNPSATPQGSAWLIGGGLLAGFGVMRRGVSGALIALIGGAMIYRGVTGCSPINLGQSAGAPDGKEPGPSHQHDEAASKQTPQDEIDEAGMESFPASDPPAKTVQAVV